MSKIKKQAAAETLPTAPVEDAGVAAATDQEVTGDGAGQALPEVDGASAERDAPAIESQAANPAPGPELSAQAIDVLVLCAGNVAGNRYEAGTVLEGVPSEVAKGYIGMLDAHPDAVFYARAHGATVIAYEG